jgi:hypothetical protein
MSLFLCVMALTLGRVGSHRRWRLQGLVLTFKKSMVIRRAGTNSDMLGAVQSMWRIGWVVLVVGGREVEGWCWLETALEGVNMTRAGTRSSTRVKLVPGGPRAFQHGHCSLS